MDLLFADRCLHISMLPASVEQIGYKVYRRDIRVIMWVKAVTPPSGLNSILRSARLSRSGVRLQSNRHVSDERAIFFNLDGEIAKMFCSCLTAIAT